jgi:DNA-binding NtrC family response regulator
MKVLKYNVLRAGNGLLIEFRGNRRIMNRIIHNVEKIVGEGLSQNGRKIKKPKIEKIEPAQILKENEQKKEHGRNFGKRYLRIGSEELQIALDQYDWDLEAVAQEFGTNKKGIRNRIQNYGLEPNI